MRILFISILFIFTCVSLATAKNDYQILIPDIYSYSIKNSQIQSAIIFKSQNIGKIKRIQSVLYSINNKNKAPVLEFKEINPTKYRIRVHGANCSFLLILGQSYHRNWKAFISDIWEKDIYKKRIKLKDILENKYLIIKGNEADQADKNEFQAYIENGWVSTLGKLNSKKKLYLYNMENTIIYENSKPYYIDYISKIIKNSIQNNNLDDGEFYETLLLKNSTSVIPDDYHWKANGFANSWWICLDRVKNTDNFIQNPDGSIDFEVVLKYFPEHIINIGFLISLTTLIISFGFLIKRKIKEI